MKTVMTVFQLSFFICASIATFKVVAEEGVCKKCEIIREENKHKVNPYEYYEDYLKAEKRNEKPQE